jgi:hypothetical protein
VKGAAAMVYTCRKEFNKYDLDAALCSLPYHNDWSRWFAISSPHPLAVPSFSFMAGVAKEYITKLGCEKYFRRVTLPSTAGDALIPVKRYLSYIRLIGPSKILQSVTTDFLRTQLFSSKCEVGLGYHLILIPLFPERPQQPPP